jgi:hypothetical protein
LTDTQPITLALVFVAAIRPIMYNNSRITDLRNDMNARFGEFRADVGKRFDDIDKRFDDVNRHIEGKYKLLDAKLDRIIEMLASHDQRLYKLEHPDS